MSKLNKVISETAVRLGEVRFSYVNVFSKRQNQDGTPGKYSVCVIIPKSNTEAVEMFKAAYEAARAAGKTTKWGGKIPAKVQLPLHDGDEERPEDPAFEDCWYFNCSSNNAPGIRVKDESGSLTLTLPTPSPSSPVSCIFTGSYLEKKLDPADPVRDVYTLGLPMTSVVSKDEDDYGSTGDINAPVPEFATSGVGFYINATLDKESDPKESLWQRNNLYVQHNKIYYRAPAEPSLTPKHNSGVEFVPVIFEGNEQQPEGKNPIIASDGVYDILGRKVASDAEAKDGSWQHRLAPGIYIVNGQKIYIH